MSDAEIEAIKKRVANIAKTQAAAKRISEELAAEKAKRISRDSKA